MSNWVQWVLAALPSLLLLALWGGLKFSARQWISNFIDSRFQKANADHQHKLDRDHSEFKSTLEKDLRKFQLQTDSKLNRIRKLQDMELTIFPEVYELLLIAQTNLNRYLGLTLIQYPTLDNLSQERIHTILAKFDWLEEAEIKEIASSGNPQRIYNNKFGNYLRWQAEKSISELNNYMLKNKIFIEKEIYEDFEKLRQGLWSAFVKYKVGVEASDHEMQLKAQEVNFIPDIELVAEKIRNRLVLE